MENSLWCLKIVKGTLQINRDSVPVSLENLQLQFNEDYILLKK